MPFTVLLTTSLNYLKCKEQNGTCLCTYRSIDVISQLMASAEASDFHFEHSMTVYFCYI